eukprot:175231-Pyramimonas_sp.AAC.1
MLPEVLLGTRFIGPPPPYTTIFFEGLSECRLACVDCGPLLQRSTELVKVWGLLEPERARSARD